MLDNQGSLTGNCLANGVQVCWVHSLARSFCHGLLGQDRNAEKIGGVKQKIIYSMCETITKKTPLVHNLLVSGLGVMLA